MTTDWMLTFAKHREQFAPAIKDKRIRAVNPQDQPTWIDLLLEHADDLED